jgi:hypothetical protein
MPPSDIFGKFNHSDCPTYTCAVTVRVNTKGKTGIRFKFERNPLCPITNGEMTLCYGAAFVFGKGGKGLARPTHWTSTAVVRLDRIRWWVATAVLIRIGGGAWAGYTVSYRYSYYIDRSRMSTLFRVAGSSSTYSTDFKIQFPLVRPQLRRNS